MISSAIRACTLVIGVMALCSVSMAADPLFKDSEPVPKDAIVLFDGKDLSQFVMRGSDTPPTWKVENGYCEPRNGDISSKQEFKDCQLHVEFWLPLMADKTGQGRANSGVFLMGASYEIQVLDSYGLKPSAGDCGAIYSYAPPMVNACRPAEQWQSYDIIFHAPKFDADGKKTANARVTVLQNGVLIHDNAEIPGSTLDRSAAEPKEAGPIQLQDHGCPVHFRNIWVRPL